LGERKKMARVTVALALAVSFSAWLVHADGDASPSYMRPYKPSMEHELIVNRIERLEHRCNLRVIDFVYFLAPGDDLIIEIDVKREGKPDKLKSKVLRLSSGRQRFREDGIGVFSVTVEQRPEKGFFWYFDLDAGGGYGLFCGEFAYKGEGPVEYEPEDQPGKKLILRRTSDDGKIDIRVSAQICRAEKRIMNPTIRPLYAADSQQEDAH
jgi:hypothetical protein